jgi:hypothetical protein
MAGHEVAPDERERQARQTLDALVRRARDGVRHPFREGNARQPVRYAVDEQADTAVAVHLRNRREVVHRPAVAPWWTTASA